MRFALPLLALATFASAQNATDSAAFAAGLIASLTASGYNSLVNIVTSVGATPEGIKLLGDLQTGEKTLFAPSDGALSGVSTNITSNATLLAQVLSYHVLVGKYNVSSVANAPDHTIARTTLQGDVYANIGGGRGQALVLYQTNGSGIQVDAPYDKWVARPYNVSTRGVSTYANLTIVGLDEVINLPPTVGQFATQNASTAAAALTSVGMVGPLESLTGLTIFLPTNEALAKLPPTAISSLNQSALITVFQNHVVNNSVLYSTGLRQPATSFAGESLTFARNGSVFTVQSGNITASVVHADIITRNGVIHLIDTVLLNTASNPQAVASVKSVQATQTATSTSDIGVGPTSGVVGPGGNASASASASASVTTGAGFVSFSMNKGLVGALALVGAAFVLV